MFEEFFSWAKEYGDVLGTVGFLFAMLTVILTNGKVILQRLRGDPFPGISPIMPGGINLPAGTSSHSTSMVVADAPPPMPDYAGKTPIAVLPPKERGAFDDHFAAGFADDLIADLQRALFATPDIETVARLVTAGADTAKIARDLGVKHVLTTSIRRQDSKIRINAQLIDPTGAVLWSERFDEQSDDLMTIQESIAGKTANAVSALLKPADGLRDPKTGMAFKTRSDALLAISSPKSRLIALMLCIPPLGIFGVHRFYVGRPYTGLLFIPTGGLVIFGWLIDTVLIAMGMFADGNGRPLRIWRHDPLNRLVNRHGN